MVLLFRDGLGLMLRINAELLKHVLKRFKVTAGHSNIFFKVPVYNYKNKINAEPSNTFKVIAERFMEIKVSGRPP